MLKKIGDIERPLWCAGHHWTLLPLPLGSPVGGRSGYQGEALQSIVTPQRPFPKKTSYSTIRA